MSIQAAWKLVKSILQQGQRSPETDAQLLGQLDRLVHDREGLSRLTGYIRGQRSWPPGNPFLQLLAKALEHACENGLAGKLPDATRELAGAIAQATDPSDRAHRTMLTILSRMNGRAHLEAVRRDLSQLWKRDCRRDTLSIVREVLGPTIPQQEWSSTLAKLLETDESKELKAKLRDAIEQLDRGAHRGRSGTGGSLATTKAVEHAPRPAPAPPSPTPNQAPEVATAEGTAEPSPASDGSQGPDGDLRRYPEHPSTSAKLSPNTADRSGQEEETRDRRERPSAPPDGETAPPPQGQSASTPPTEPPPQIEEVAPSPDAPPNDLSATLETPEPAGTAEARTRDEVAQTGSPSEPARPIASMPEGSGPEEADGEAELAAGGPERTASGDTAAARRGATGEDAPPPAAASSATAPRQEPKHGPPAAETSDIGEDPAPATEPPEAPKPTKAKSPKAQRTAKTTAAAPTEGTATPASEATLANLEAYLAEVTQNLMGLFRDRDGDRKAYLAECARVERENEQLAAKLATAQRNAEALTSALEEARSLAAGQATRIAELELNLAAGEEARRSAEEKSRELAKDLDDAYREIEDAERRARDRIHRAEKEKELGVRTFRFELRRRIEPLLSEVLDDERGPGELNPEQSRLHQRLRKILGVLRESGVMGD